MLIISCVLQPCCMRDFASLLSWWWWRWSNVNTSVLTLHWMGLVTFCRDYQRIFFALCVQAWWGCMLHACGPWPAFTLCMCEGMSPVIQLWEGALWCWWGFLKGRTSILTEVFPPGPIILFAWLRGSARSISMSANMKERGKIHGVSLDCQPDGLLPSFDIHTKSFVYLVYYSGDIDFNYCPFSVPAFSSSSPLLILAVSEENGQEWESRNVVMLMEAIWCLSVLSLFF